MNRSPFEHIPLPRGFEHGVFSQKNKDDLPCIFQQLIPIERARTMKCIYHVIYIFPTGDITFAFMNNPTEAEQDAMIQRFFQTTAYQRGQAVAEILAESQTQMV